MCWYRSAIADDDQAITSINCPISHAQEQVDCWRVPGAVESPVSDSGRMPTAIPLAQFRFGLRSFGPTQAAPIYHHKRIESYIPRLEDRIYLDSQADLGVRRLFEPGPVRG
jgi:hypothetical protein